MRHTRIAAAAALAATLAAAPAQAHVTLQPAQVPAGGFTRLDVRVPNERDTAGTTKVQVQFPPGFASVSTEPKPGWRMAVRMRKKEVDTVAFTARRGTRIAPGEFVDFGLSLAVPDKPGTTLTFKALQTYDNGEVVRWIGTPDAEEPAPRVELAAAGEEDRGSAPAQEELAGTAGGEDEGASTGLVVAALILGGLGLLTGIAGLMTARRAREGTA